jgi:hypothetical protein
MIENMYVGAILVIAHSLIAEEGEYKIRPYIITIPSKFLFSSLHSLED